MTANGVDTLAFVNNAICADMTRKWLEREGIAPDRVALVLLRKLTLNWAADCAAVIAYPVRPSGTLLGQRHVAGFYAQAARFVRRWLGQPGLRQVLLPNNDNLLTNHVFRWAEDHPQARIVVVAEGFMNYQQIGQENRAGWRWRVKPLVAAALGLRYRPPQGHLSGAFEPTTTQVVAFAAEGLMAPADKMLILPYPTVTPARPANPRIALVLHSGLAHWMAPKRFEEIAHGFANWLRAQDFEKIYAKHHPHVSAGMIEDLMPPHEILEDSRPLEALLPELEAGTLAATCSTALVTAKLIRPELRCVDYGADHYLEHAYQGDRNLTRLMAAVGVEMVPLGRPGTSPVQVESPT